MLDPVVLGVIARLPVWLSILAVDPMSEMPMSRLFRYLLMLTHRRFYGVVNIPFHNGNVSRITVTQGFLEGELPQPHPELLEVYEAEVQQALKEE